MAARATDRLAHDDRVLPVTRAVSLAIIPFLVLAFVVLYVWPRDTDRLFAWPIKPPLTPMILGSVYLGGAYFFLRAARASRWHTIKGGFPPVATFATLMGIATIVHWQKFNHAHVAFWLWAALYFTTPFLVAGVWLANRRREDRSPVDDVVVPETMARIIGAVGVLAVATGLFLFLFPQLAIDLWPWMLTPLTARVMGAIFALGLAATGAFTERRWSAFRIMLQVEMLMLVLILVGGIRAAGDLDSSNVLTWLLAAGFALLVVASIVLYARMEQRTRAPSAHRKPTRT
jgi:hypothetical protein